MKTFKRVAIVTGAGQGIGRAISSRLLIDGFAVVAAEKDVEGGREVEMKFSEIGDIFFVRTDVCSEGSIKRLIQVSIKKFGRIDVVVNNAALIDFTPMEKLSLQGWNKSLQTNLTGPYLMAKHAAPHLKKTKGAIINITSVRAIASVPHQEVYGATKGGLLSLTHCLALSLGPEVRVNAISPGWIDTTAWQKSTSTYRLKLRRIDHTQHPAGRVGKPEDVASMVSFLADSKNNFLTGGNFIVDGGMTKKLEYLD